MRPVQCLLIISIAVSSCSRTEGSLLNCSWSIQYNVLSARKGNFFDNVAVKDPTIVFFDGKYHLFYTAKSMHIGDSTEYYGISCGYVSAHSIDKLCKAERISIDELAGCDVIAPQVFYFEPQKCWYLIAHTPVEIGNLTGLKPIYLTNPDIDNASGWTKAAELKTGKTDDEFWIDFWVICDDYKAYLFYSNQDGSLYRLDCELDEFPEGFSDSNPELALYVNHMNSENPWKFFEAAHIYHVEKMNKYLALLEGAYPHPTRKGMVDSRNRFIFGMIADSLNGSWTRIESDEDKFMAEAHNLQINKSDSAKYTQISHPELIRTGYNQKLEISDYNLTMIFQSFDGSAIPDSYDYNGLPWDLVIAKNF